MAGPPKQAPLETFLTGVTAPQPSQTSGEPKPSEEMSAAAARRSLILTILDQAKEALAEDVLAARSELGSEACRHIVADLQGEGLIARTESGYVLTSRGRTMAQEERRRLLSF